MTPQVQEIAPGQSGESPGGCLPVATDAPDEFISVAASQNDFPNESTVESAAALDRRNPLSRRNPINRGRALSRLFFAEGERQQETDWEDSQLIGNGAANSVEFTSFDRLPLRRAPLIMAAAVIVGIVVASYAVRGLLRRSVGAGSNGRMALLLVGTRSGAQSGPAIPDPPPTRPSMLATVVQPSCDPVGTPSSLPIGDTASVSIVEPVVATPGPAVATTTTSASASPDVMASVFTAPPPASPIARQLVSSRRETTRARHARHGSSATRTRQLRAAALKGYVVTPGEGQLVSAESLTPTNETPAPTERQPIPPSESAPVETAPSASATAPSTATDLPSTEPAPEAIEAPVERPDVDIAKPPLP